MYGSVDGVVVCVMGRVCVVVCVVFMGAYLGEFWFVCVGNWLFVCCVCVCLCVVLFVVCVCVCVCVCICVG